MSLYNEINSRFSSGCILMRLVHRIDVDFFSHLFEHVHTHSFSHAFNAPVNSNKSIQSISICIYIAIESNVEWTASHCATLLTSFYTHIRIEWLLFLLCATRAFYPPKKKFHLNQNYKCLKETNKKLWNQLFLICFHIGRFVFRLIQKHFLWKYHQSYYTQSQPLNFKQTNCNTQIFVHGGPTTDIGMWWTDKHTQTVIKHTYTSAVRIKMSIRSHFDAIISTIFRLFFNIDSVFLSFSSQNAFVSTKVKKKLMNLPKKFSFASIEKNAFCNFSKIMLSITKMWFPPKIVT